MSDSLRPHELQHVRHPCPSPTPGVYSTHVHLVGDAIQPSHPLLSLSPAPNPSQPQSLFPWATLRMRWPNYWSFNLSTIPKNTQNMRFRNMYIKADGKMTVQFSSVAQSCPTLWDPMDCSMPDLPVHHQLTEFTQTHAHWVSDAIQPSHPLSTPSLTFNLSQHQGHFKWVSSSHQVAKVLAFQLQHQSFQWTFKTDFL